MNSNIALENQLNAAIAERGYRISPRAPLGDRLARYIQMTYSTRGREVDTDEAQAVAAMMMMKCSDVSLEEPLEEQPQSKRRRTVTMQEDGNVTVTIEGSHPMTRRSQTQANGSCCMRRASPSPSASGSHPMVRRSQIARR